MAVCVGACMSMRSIIIKVHNIFSIVNISQTKINASLYCPSHTRLRLLRRSADLSETIERSKYNNTKSKCHSMCAESVSEYFPIVLIVQNQLNLIEK